MVLRLLFRLLGNNEQLVARLAESYPVRRAAQMFVYFFNKGKAITEDKINPSSITDKLKSVRDLLEKESKK